MEAEVGIVIVTYNRKDYLKELINSFKQQTYEVKNIFILDNHSTDGTDQYIKNEFQISEVFEDKILEGISKDKIKVFYYRNSNNSGGAGGFNKAFELVKEMNIFKYIWVMDDDVVPEKECLENLMRYQNQNRMITIPNRTDANYVDQLCTSINLTNPFKIFMRKKTVCKADKLDYLKECIDVVDMPFEGPLINMELLEKVGLPDKDYFIQFDDTDYATRSIEHTRIGFICNARLHKQIILTNDKKRRFNWKDYYAYRNDILFCRKYGKNIWVRYLTPIFLYVNLILKAAIKRKWKNIKVINKAFIDGCKGRKGKTVNPGDF